MYLAEKKESDWAVILLLLLLTLFYIGFLSHNNICIYIQIS